MKYQMIQAYVIQPKLIRAARGFSYAKQLTIDYREIENKAHFLGNHTPPAVFKREQ